VKRKLAPVFLVALSAACGSSGKAVAPSRPTAEVVTGTRGAPIRLSDSEDLREVAELENARTLGNGRLLALLEKGAPDVRARAATALGRLPYPAFGEEVTAVLARALEDIELEVRLAAAFAMGVRGDPDSAGTLLAYRNDPEPRLRARVVEAASKLPDASLHAQVTLSLRDSDLGVRMEAAVGAARWDPKASDGREVDRALLDALNPYRITRDSAPKTAIEAELVWRILWALGRRKAELGRGPFLEYSSSQAALERLFALRGLGQLAPNRVGVQAAIGALDGPNAASDWRVAFEACQALGRFGLAPREGLDDDTKKLLADEVVIRSLAKASEHANPHVRAAAVDALAGYGDGDAVLAVLQRGRLDLSVSVRAATLRARVQLSSGEDALEALRRAARDDDPVLRGAAAEAAGTLRDARAGEVLITLTRDPSLFVSTRAVEQLGKHPSNAARKVLHECLAHADNGIRLAAVLALKEIPDAADAAPAMQAFTSAIGDGSSELAYNVLQLLAKLPSNEGRLLVEKAQTDARPYVRAVAKKLVRESFGFTPGEAEPPFRPDHGVPVLGKDYPAWTFNPMVELATTQGTLVFELFPAEAPVHVFNFMKLIESGHYDGLTFHRVVPDFVVQGGDYRGDGNGAKPFAGEALRAEFTPRKSTRGSLGMPRNDDPDSGGSQFFVTHLPTPHLDGRYTFFGELRAGGNTLDQLEVGDRILSARILR
jgi:cyclophilin family peptidyl-prolyl cis-trans isomerase/HEAT repeat protein